MTTIDHPTTSKVTTGDLSAYPVIPGLDLSLTVLTSSKIQHAVVLITPDDAAVMLDDGRNDNNRRLIRGHTPRLRDDMRSGQWQVNGEPIIVGWDGSLLDGQHRLVACIEAGAPFATLLVWNVDPAVKATIDTGKKRLLSHQLSVLGYRDTNYLAAAIGFGWSLDHDLAQSRATPSHSVALDWLRAHPSIVTAISPGRQWVAQPLMVSSMVALNAERVFRAIDAQAWEVFRHQVILGVGLAEDSGAFALRNYLIRQGSIARNKTQKRDSPSHVWAMLTKAWNAEMEGREVKLLRFNSNEGYPVPVGPDGEPVSIRHLPDLQPVDESGEGE